MPVPGSLIVVLLSDQQTLKEHMVLWYVLQGALKPNDHVTGEPTGFANSSMCIVGGAGAPAS
jgi:hypothetical protein